MQSWIKFVEPDHVDEEKHYFLGRHYNPGHPYHEGCSLVGRNAKGQAVLTVRPGTAIRFKGIESMRRVMEANEGLRIIEIPADADTRWTVKKSRKRRF